MIATQPDTVCHVCGIPADASYFDDSSIVDAPQVNGAEVVLARRSSCTARAGMVTRDNAIPYWPCDSCGAGDWPNPDSVGSAALTWT